MSDVEEPVEEELDPYDEEIAALGPAPGMGASAIECDQYNHALADIESRRAQEVNEAQEDLPPSEDTSGQRDDVDVLLSQEPAGAAPEPRGDDGTGRAAGS